MMPPLQLVLSHPPYEAAAVALSERLQQPLHTQATASEGFVLDYTPEGLSLRLADAKGMLPLRVDFTEGGALHRRKFGGGAGQMIAKAVGVQSRTTPQVIDATAGLGGDGFVLACLGCTVALFERSPVVHALLADGLERARQFALAQDAELLTILNRITLHSEDAQTYFAQPSTPKAQVIYLDPMFPERSKSAAVKKSMQFFHRIVGDDADAAALFQAALAKTQCRLVVKRPRLAPLLGEAAPNLVFTGKACRFDVYALKKLTE